MLSNGAFANLRGREHFATEDIMLDAAQQVRLALDQFIPFVFDLMPN